MSPRLKQLSKPGLDLAEAALVLLRRAPFHAWATYAMGTSPFISAVVLYWALMLQVPHAQAFLAEASLLLSLLFVWMKVCQARFCHILLGECRGCPPAPWGPREIGRQALRYCCLQTAGVILVPLTMPFFLAYPRFYGQFQHQLVQGATSPNASVKTVWDESARTARLWPRQNFFVMWLLSPYPMLVSAFYLLILMPAMAAALPIEVSPLLFVLGVLLTIVMFILGPLAFFLAINIIAAITTGTSLFTSLTGIPTVFSLQQGLFTSGTMVVVVCALVYIFMDPCIKAAYVLRTFYADAITTGEDLRVLLRSAKNTARTGLLALLLAAAVFVAVPASAQEAVGVSPDALDQALSQELSDWRYTWRDPLATAAIDENSLFAWILARVADGYDWIKEQAEYFRKWVISRNEQSAASPSGAWLSPEIWFQILFWLLLGVLVLFLGLSLLQLWKRGRRPRLESAPMPPQESVPDLADEQVTADALPEDQWLELARQCAERGDFRLAVRALFLATLAHLAHRQWVRIAPAKTNSEYRAELQSHTTATHGVMPLFNQSVRLYEFAWYGDHPADAQTVETLLEQQSRLRHA